MQPTAVLRHTAGTAQQFAENKSRLVLTAKCVKGRGQDAEVALRDSVRGVRLFLGVERMPGGFWGQTVLITIYRPEFLVQRQVVNEKITIIIASAWQEK